MNDVKHTPGPWEIAEHTSGEVLSQYWIVNPDFDNVVCRLNVCDALLQPFPDAGIVKANANLIAAAPEMLKTLQEAYRVLAESHMENGELHWVTPGETLLERLSNVIEDTTGQKPPPPSPSAKNTREGINPEVVPLMLEMLKKCHDLISFADVEKDHLINQFISELDHVIGLATEPSPSA